MGVLISLLGLFSFNWIIPLFVWGWYIDVFGVTEFMGHDDEQLCRFKYKQYNWRS